MRIAHISDLHVLALDRVPLRVLLRGKRAQGYANLMLKRRYEHDEEVARIVLRDLRSRAPDHVVITGDVSNLALPQEFTAARELIASALGFDRLKMTIVPGNHDAYTREAYRSRAFERVFGDWLGSDEPFRRDQDHPYPVVHLRHGIAIIGLTSAVPRGAFVASGEVGAAQLKRLEALLRHEELRSRPLLVLVHHPVMGMRGVVHTWMQGLRDGDALLWSVGERPDVLIVHGHLHRPVFHRVASRSGEVQVAGVTSASLTGKRRGQQAGYQLIEREDGGWRVRRLAYDERRGCFEETLAG